MEGCEGQSRSPDKCGKTLIRYSNASSKADILDEAQAGKGLHIDAPTPRQIEMLKQLEMSCNLVYIIASQAVAS
jgi:hypothetical protein